MFEGISVDSKGVLWESPPAGWLTPTAPLPPASGAVAAATAIGAPPSSAETVVALRPGVRQSRVSQGCAAANLRSNSTTKSDREPEALNASYLVCSMRRMTANLELIC
jgi:hypothetical protein